MLTNRSIPRCTVIPELAYADVGEAVNWLCRAFGFSPRLQIGTHRAQLNVGSDGAVVLTDRATRSSRDAPDHGSWACAVMVRVEDVHRHHAREMAHGARVVRSPAEYPYGERQYTVEDLGGYHWTFSQSIVDVAPGDWGGALVAGLRRRSSTPDRPSQATR